ncbi:hypothetical protein [Inquilinus sp. CAU 1745]|uniref:hypothetical protein n=1 Tax=Inquilinus sp. CAU 1745 TaxID=3140369 RepID=UPI00325C18BA
MRNPAAVAVVLACLVSPAASAAGLDPAQGEAARAIVVRSHDGGILASVPLHGEHFAVSYRNSIYGTPAEERYEVLPDGRYRLVQIAADQLAVLEEYYAVPGAPRRAEEPDRREWVVPPDPAHPLVLERLSIAATDLGERTVHVPGAPPLELWRLVEDGQPFVVLGIEENP